MLTIKLSPIGKTHAIKYRVVVLEKRTKLTRDAREILGYFEPKSNKLEVDQARLKYWLEAGAQPSGRLRKLLSL